MKVFQTTQQILAAQILSIIAAPPVEGEAQPDEPQFIVKTEHEQFSVGEGWLKQVNPEVGGYLVLTAANDAGFISAKDLLSNWTQIGVHELAPAAAPEGDAPAEKPAAEYAEAVALVDAMHEQAEAADASTQPPMSYRAL